MAIVVLVLWMFTAGAGFYLLVTSNLGRARPAAATPAAEPTLAESATVSTAASAISAAQAASVTPAAAAPATPAASPAQAASAARPLPRRRLPPSGRCGGRRGTGSTRPR